MDDVIRAAAGGDREAFAALVEEYQKPVYNLCLRMVGNQEDAADLAQEAFLRVWKGLPFFKFDSAFTTWLYRLTNNVCIDFLRRQKRYTAVSTTFLDDDEQEQDMQLEDPAQGPEAQAIHREDKAALEQAMDTLEVEYRQALTLRAVNGLSYAEIAQVLDVKEGTVKSRISRAREKLRKKLLDSGNLSPVSASIQAERGQNA